MAIDLQMINLQLTLDQAQKLHDLLTRMNMEPLEPLLKNLKQTTAYPLWPVLDALRQQMQIANFTGDSGRIEATKSD